MWLELAARQEHQGAILARDALAKTMKAEDIAAAKLQASSWKPVVVDNKPTT